MEEHLGTLGRRVHHHQFHQHMFLNQKSLHRHHLLEQLLIQL
jgi:hypothetical protein